MAGSHRRAYSIVSDGHPEYQRSPVSSTLSAESVLILQQMPSPVSPTSNPLTFQAREGSETTVTLVYRETAVILSYAEVGGVVTGRVVDEAGEPAPGLTVRLSRVGGAGTAGAEISNVPRVTDDRGEYRLFHIAAGQYFLLVSDETRNASINEPSWLPVYYPGSMAAIDAIPLTVGRSQELAGIDVIFSRSRGTRVSGYVFNAAGQPLRTQVRLAAPSPLSGMQVPTRIALTKDDGAFEFGGVPPGQYTLRASNTQPSATIVLSLAGSQLLPERLEPAREYGLISVSAHGDELGPVVVQTRPGASISGRLVLETSGPLSSRPVFTFVAMAAGENFPMSEQPSAMLQATVDAELQSFKINGLSGTMRLRLTAGSKNWWLKSATVNGIDATDSPITLTSSQDSTNDAIFVLADTAGSVSGRAMSGTRANGRGLGSRLPGRARAAVQRLAADRQHPPRRRRPLYGVGPAARRLLHRGGGRLGGAPAERGALPRPARGSHAACTTGLDRPTTGGDAVSERPGRDTVGPKQARTQAPPLPRRSSSPSTMASAISFFVLRR